jgi:hypothetical protein
MADGAQKRLEGGDRERHRVLYALQRSAVVQALCGAAVHLGSYDAGVAIQLLRFRRRARGELRGVREATQAPCAQGATRQRVESGDSICVGVGHRGDSAGRRRRALWRAAQRT